MDERTLLQQIEQLASAEEQPLSWPETVLGFSRSYLAGPTFNYWDNIEALAASLYGPETYEEELSTIRGQQARFKDRVDYLDNAVELVSGAILNPLDSLKKAQVVKNLAFPGAEIAKTALLSAPGQAALASAGAADGQNVLEAAAQGAVLGGGLSALGSVAGNVLEKTGRAADRMKTSAYGIGYADMAKQLRKMDDAVFDDAADIPLVKTLNAAEKKGLINAGADLVENAKSLNEEQAKLASRITTVIGQADEVVEPNRMFDIPNTLNYVESLSGTAKEQATSAALREWDTITSQLKTGSLEELQKAKVGLNYKYDKNPYTEDVIKAIRSDLRSEIEKRIDAAAAAGAVDALNVGKVKALNREWGDLQELKDAFMRRAPSDMMGNPIEDAILAGRTSGGVGTMNIASASSGNPIYSAIGAGLTAARAPESLSTMADLLRDPAIAGTTQAVGRALPEVVTGRNVAQAASAINDGREGKARQDEAQTVRSLLDEIERLSAVESTEGPTPVDKAPTKTTGSSSSGAASPGSQTADLNKVSFFDDSLYTDLFSTADLRGGNVDAEEFQQFESKVVDIAQELGANPRDLMAVMRFETGGTLNPREKNRAGSGATGLIQFMPATAKSLTGAESREAAIRIMEEMTPVEQLDYVQKYLKPFKGRLKSLDDVYMAVLWPRAVGKDPDYALFEKGTKAYWQNRGLDINKDGKITKAEATEKVRRFNGIDQNLVDV